MTVEQAAANKYERWTKDELTLLENTIQEYGRNTEQLEKVFPNRTVEEIKQKIYSLEEQKSQSQNSISPIYSNDISTRSVNNSVATTNVPTAEQLFLLQGHPGYNPEWNKVFTSIE